MRVAIVALEYPYPPDTGSRIDNYHLALKLAETHEVHVITLDGRVRRNVSRDPLVEAGIGHTSVVENREQWKRPSMWFVRWWCWVSGKSYFGTWQRKYLRQVLDVVARQRTDCLFAHKLECDLLSDVTAVPVVAGIMELGGRRLAWAAQREENPILRIWRMREARSLLHRQLDLCKKFRWSFVCMQEEIDWIEERVGKTHVQCIPYGVDTGYYAPDPSVKEECLVGGNGNQATMGGWPLASSVFPLVRKGFPNARLLLLGGHSMYPPLVELARTDSSIEIPGYLPQAEFLIQMQRPAVYAFPIEFATGTKNSVLMALSLGKPIVATRCAMSGIDLNKAAVVLAESPEEFASACVALLQDRQRRVEMGKQNRQYAVRELDWSVYTGAVDNLLQAAVAESARARHAGQADHQRSG